MSNLILAFSMGALLHAVWTWVEWGSPGKRGLRAYWDARRKQVMGATLADVVLGVLYIGGYLTPIVAGALGQLGFSGEIPIDPPMAVMAGFLADSVGKKTLGSMVRVSDV